MSKVLDDLDIKSYSLYELFGLFEVPYEIKDVHLKNIAVKVNQVEQQLSEDYVLFFKKAECIIRSIVKLREIKQSTGEINYINQEEEELFKEEIIKVPGCEMMDSKDILVLLKPKIKKEDTLQLKENEKPVKITNTFDNKVVAGKINPIKRIIQLSNLNLNSCFRDNYYKSSSTNFIYTLPDTVKNVVSMRLASIEIPNAWYLYSYNKNNNRFKIETTVCNCCKVYDIVIPDGNYDKETLSAYLNSKYFYNSDEKTDLINIKFSISDYGNKTIFELADDCPEDFVFSIHFVEDFNENMMETFGWSLGFRVGKYLNIDDAIQSEGLFDAGGDRYIYLSINDFNYNSNQYNIVCFDKSTLNEPVIAKVPMVNGKLALVIDENNGNPLTKIRRYNGPVDLKKLEIRVLDKFGNIIDLNNMDFSFTLETEILYDRNNIV